MSCKRVVITGIGPYILQGKGKEILWKTLINKDFYVSHIPDFFETNYVFNSKYYIPFPDFNFEESGLHRKYSGIMDETATLAYICARLALEDAGYELSDKEDTPFFHEDISRASVILGVGFCNLKKTIESYFAHKLSHNKQLMEDLNFSSHYNRMIIPMTMPNAISSWISILCGAHGANYTINTACSSGNYAIGEAFRKIKDGYSDIVITGGIENLKDGSGAIMRGFDTLGTLTESPDGKPMPFSKDRSGFLFSEGCCCVLILEEYERAIKRNAPIYAEIADFESNSDAKNIVLMDKEGKDITSLIREITKENTIDYISTHGTGTSLNDEVESRIIQNIYGSKQDQPVINSTKSILGHSVGASAAIEAAVCALAIQRGAIHANLSHNSIENLNIAEETIHTTINNVLSLSYGFGGHNSGLLLKKLE